MSPRDHTADSCLLRNNDRPEYSSAAVMSVFVAAMDEGIEAMRARFDVAPGAMIEPVNFAIHEALARKALPGST